MKLTIHFLFLYALAAFLLSTLCSCKKYQPGNIVINELMAGNRTGILNDNGNPADWIELKNLGTDSVDLKDYKLIVSKNTVDTSVETKNDSTESTGKTNFKEWSFPSIKIGAGECLVVFAEKTKDSVPNNSLQADFNLPKEGGLIQLIAPNDSVISKVKYKEMEPDHSIALQSDSTYKSTLWQSPGFENNREGYENASKHIDSQRKDPLLIWELMSRATHSYENWVELKNTGNQPVDLSAYSLSKKMGKKEEAWQLPAKTLAPGEIISFQMVGSKAKKNSNQAPFKLGDAETVVLTKDGKFVDGICGKLTPYQGSIGRKKGEKGFFFFSKPTPNAENSNTRYRYISGKPEWNHKPGIYVNQDKMILKLNNPGKPVHYTLDGSEPTMKSPVFKDSLTITGPAVVRSFAEGDSITMQSPVATASYLLGVKHDLPVVNISLDNSDLFDFNKGIYANGPGYGDSTPHLGANFWKNWTKKAYVELFDDKEGFSSDCGLKIFGAYSRALDKKSFRIKFRGEFGDAKVNYDFFDTGEPMEFEDLVFRSGSQDYNRCMIRDEFFTSLAQSGSYSILTQMYRPVALYINAKYFGLYYIREKIDKNFVARKLNLPNDSIDIYLSGASPYRTLVNRIANLDMRQKDNYEFAKDNIDLISLIDYKIGNIFAGKTDVGNIRHVRSLHQDSDKKWRFVFYDIDYSWSADGKPSAAHYLSTSPEAIVPEKAFQNILTDRLLKNKEFRQLFLERLSYHLTNTYAAENTLEYFDKFINTIRAEMKNNCNRWPKLSYQKWEKNIEQFRSRFENRPKVILNDLRKFLSITEEENKKYFAHLGY